MNDYDFSTLNDKEFENISIDLVSRDNGKRYERFKVGRDGGVDGRFYGEDGLEEIIQCKHYLKTGFNGLISSLKKKNNGKNEPDKVKLLNPKRYIFVTSLTLSAANKKKIKEIFNPYIKKDCDIYGQEDLNGLLKANKDIEENHYKLWISSTTVLQRIFNNAIKGRSEFLLDEIKENIKYYVMTENHNKAIEKLESSHTIIIAGEPGIGKSTLAEQIVLSYIEQGFEFCVIAKDISEAEGIFEKDKKQIFYFDDFLGSNYINALEAHSDSHIMQFITRIKKDKDKRFILTSRTNIFNQGILLSDKFKVKKLDSDEFIIKVESLKDIDKAKILYNHLYHSNLDEVYIDELYKEERYKQIIKHKNFNPRLIEFITDIERIKSLSASYYWNDIEDSLDNPKEIWANTFDKQSSEYIRNIITLVVFNGNSMEEKKLKDAYIKLNKLEDLKNNNFQSKTFESVIEETVKYFLNRTQTYKETIEYSLFNPSIADFILNRYQNDNSSLINIYLSLYSMESLKNLSYNKNNIDEYEIILRKLYDELDIEDYDNIDYIIQLLYMVELKSLELNYKKRNTFFQSIIDSPIDFNLINEFSTILMYLDEEDIVINNYDFILKLIENVNIDVEDINKIIELLNHYDIKLGNIVEALNQLIQEYLVIVIDDSSTDIDIDDVAFDQDINGEIYANDSDIEQYFENLLDDTISEIDRYPYIEIDNKYIMNTIDMPYINERLATSYIDSNVDDSYSIKNHIKSEKIFDSIEDLFER